MSLNGNIMRRRAESQSLLNTRLRAIAAGLGGISFLMIESIKAEFLPGGSKPLVGPFARAKKGADESRGRLFVLTETLC